MKPPSSCGVNLGNIIGDAVEADRFALEPRFATLSPRETATVDFARKVTRAPREVVKEDIMDLRSRGFSDQQVIEVPETAGHFNFANRMFMSFGCPIDDRVVARVQG